MADHDAEFAESGEWTLEENALRAALPMEKSPSPELKRRTVEELSRRALLGGSVAHSNRRVFALLAAASVIFIAGAFVGYAAAQRSAKPVDDARMANAPQAVAKAASVKTDSQPTRYIVWY
jgi:hypothetical protein